MAGVEGNDECKVGIVQRLGNATRIAQGKVNARQSRHWQSAVKVWAVQGFHVVLTFFRVPNADLGNRTTCVGDWPHGVSEPSQCITVQIQAINVTRQMHWADGENCRQFAVSSDAKPLCGAVQWLPREKWLCLLIRQNGDFFFQP